MEGTLLLPLECFSNVQKQAKGAHSRLKASMGNPVHALASYCSATQRRCVIV